MLCYRTVERYYQKLLEEETKALDKLDNLTTLHEALRMLMKSTLLDDKQEREGQRVKELCGRCYGQCGFFIDYYCCYYVSVIIQ